MEKMAEASAELLDWPKKDNRRFLHVVYRVGDLDRTIKFYTECFGMKLLRKRDIPEEKYSNAFLGFGPETSNFVVELTYNYGVSSYDIGTGFGHFAISTQDVSKMVETVRANGGNVTREPGPVKGGGSVIAFVKDPDGYPFELIQRGPTPEPLCQVMLRVGDLDRAIKFYEKALGMRLLRKIERPEYKYTIGMMGYAEEYESIVLELTYNYDVTEYTKGNAYAQIAIGTDDVYKSGEVVKIVNQELGGKITREAGPLPGLGTKIVAFLDPDGWKTLLRIFLHPRERERMNLVLSNNYTETNLATWDLDSGSGGQQRFSEGTGIRREMMMVEVTTLRRNHNVMIIKENETSKMNNTLYVYTVGCRRVIFLLTSTATIVKTAEASSAELLDWPKKDNRPLLHVVYRVGDLDRTIKFYTECFGMKLLRKRDVPEEKYTNAFLGFGPETSNFVVELTYNYNVSSYDIGTGFGHFAIATQDVSKVVETVRAKGGKVIREPGPVKGRGSVGAFVKDPDGYAFELIQRGPTREPLCQVMLRVGDLDRAIKFYEKALGMKLLRKIERPSNKYTIGMMGYGKESDSTVLELTYKHGVTQYTKGTAYAQMAIGTDDVYKSGEVVKIVNQELGGKITREAGPVPGLGTKIVSFLDPDGWKTVLVDNKDFLKELK
ncbi:unnamed protein product [Thlaspi arvense]|uniref:Lactoylglutathione lyase n=1 Tax=Thlaspi arvense TaxID=13288 RepID=A0AAU9RBU7_THLAR|nr:unnamed protein product [Thlaspi arvense]